MMATEVIEVLKYSSLKVKDKQMGKYNTKEKLEYLNHKVEDDDTPSSKKFQILDFFAQCTGLLGNELHYRMFFQKLNELTAEIDPKPKKK